MPRPHLPHCARDATVVAQLYHDVHRCTLYFALAVLVFVYHPSHMYIRIHAPIPFALQETMQETMKEKSCVESPPI